MKKGVCFLIVLFLMAVSQGYGQHSVNDIAQYSGWYKINIELDSSDTIHYNITQCYPNGDEYVLNSSESRQLPLYVKIFCISISEEVLKGQMESMTFNEDGIYMRLVGYTIMIDFSETEDKILETLGEEIVNKYRYSDW
jgi:hypothetical protein